MEEISYLITEYMLKQADPDGRPSYGRAYGTKKLTLLKKADPSVLDIVLKSKLTEEAKANIFVTLADAISMNDQGISENLTDVTAFIKSLTTTNVLSAYPVWCYPDYVPIINTREATEKHYIKRQNALVNLGRIGDGTPQLYRFLENFDSYFYVENRCLCNFVKGRGRKEGGDIILNIRKKFGEGKVGVATLVTDQHGNPFIMKTIALRHMKKSSIGLGSVAPNNPITDAIKFGDNKFVAVGSDDFTNQTIMHMILNLKC